ncbi:MAG: Unannotated protein [Actinomycetota bacterium]|nr:Unannotated protein [Actinomycetota bacterium]
MLTIDEAVARIVREVRQHEPDGVVVDQVWAADDRVVVFWSRQGLPPGLVRSRGNGVGHSSAVVRRAGGGRVEHLSSSTPPEEYLAGTVRVPWQPWRPVDPMISSTRIRKCRNCRGRLVPVVWGDPGPELFELAERGEVALGGCCLPGPGDDQELKGCATCGWRLLVEPNVPDVLEVPDVQQGSEAPDIP